MTSIEKQLNQIIRDNRDIEQNTALLKEYKDKLRNSNFDLAGIKDMHTIAEVILSELQKIKSEIEQAIESVAKTKDYIKFKTYTENIARIQEFRLFLQKCELFLSGKITEVALMENLEALLKDEIFQERNVEEKISAYQRLMQKGKGVVASVTLVGTLLGGFVAADMIRPKSAYAMEAEASIPQDMYENIAKRMEKLNSEKKYDAAIELAKDYMNQTDNKNFKFFNELGSAYIINNKFHDAIPYLKKALTLNSSFIDAHANLGVAYTKIGDYKAALVEFKKVKELNPSHPSADKWIQFINKKL